MSCENDLIITMTKKMRKIFLEIYKRKRYFFIITILLLLSKYSLAEKGNFTLSKCLNLSLKRNANILLQKQDVLISKSNIKISQSKFDTNINPSISYSHSEVPITPSTQEKRNISQAEVEITKQLRTGISLKGGAQSSRISEINSPVEPAVSTVIYFTINVPLLEGLGKDVAAADELSAKSEFKASKLKLAHTVSETVYKTTQLYWDYLRNIKNLNEYKHSLNRTKILLQQVKILIEKDLRPRSDIDQIIASIANKNATVLNAEQQVIESRNALITYLGLDPKEFNIVSYPATQFPQISNEDIVKLKSYIQKMKNLALKYRFDYLALLQNEKTIKIQLKYAKNKLKNNLDLNFNVSYKRLDREQKVSGMWTGFWENRPGFNVDISLNYEWPIENSYAKGLVLKYLSLLHQNKINQQQLKRTIISNIETAISDVENSYKSYIEALTSVKYYKTVIFNEKQKYKLGMSTIIDIINIEDKLTEAHLNEILAHYKLACAIAKLNKEIGKIVEANPEKEYFKINIKNLITLREITNGE